MQAKSQFLSPVSSFERERWFPGVTPYPQAGPGAGLLPSRFVEDQESKPRAPVCLCKQQSCKPVPKHGWCLGLRKPAQLSACLCSEQAGNHPTGASLCLPGRTGSHLPLHSSATSKGGSWLLGAMRSCLLCMLNSGFWFSPCQAGTAALLTWENTARVESSLIGKEAGKSESEVHSWEPGRCQEEPK